MPVQVFVWDFRGYTEAWGHSSLQLSNGKYVSWWPTKAYSKLSVVTELKSPVKADKDRTYKDDVEGEEQDPDTVYEIPGLDEAAIDAWWVSFKHSHDYGLMKQNCSTTVKDALKAGGAWTKLTTEQREEFDDISVWTPKHVDNLCKALTQ